MNDRIQFGELSPADAESIVVEFLPNFPTRIVLLRQLLDSVVYARGVAPNACGVTLYSDAFRVNVGQVEVLVVDGANVRLNCLGQLGEAPFTGPCYHRTEYKSVRNPGVAFYGRHDEFATVVDQLRIAHNQFIDSVGRRKSGEPVVGSPHMKSHTEALVEYAREQLDSAARRFVADV